MKKFRIFCGVVLALSLCGLAASVAYVKLTGSVPAAAVADTRPPAEPQQPTEEPPATSATAPDLAKYCHRREFDLEGYLDACGYAPLSSALGDYAYINGAEQIIAITVDESHECLYVGDGCGNMRQFGSSSVSSDDENNPLGYGEYLARLSYWDAPEGRLDEEATKAHYDPQNAHRAEVEISREGLLEIISLATR